MHDLNNPSPALTFDSDVQSEIKVVAGQTKIRMNHNALTAEFVLHAVQEHARSGRIVDGLDREAIHALRDIPAIREALRMTLQTRNVQAQKPIQAYTPGAHQTTQHEVVKPKFTPEQVEAALPIIDAALATTKILDLQRFERRQYYRELWNNQYGAFRQKEVARIYGLINDATAKAVFLDKYQFTAEEMEQWAKLQ